jgi:hypothetical protein
MESADPAEAIVRRGWLALALLGAGCTVGQGVGEVKGEIYIIDCNLKSAPDLGARDQPVPYDLKPKFFGAEQLLHLGTMGATARVNRLIMRLQSSGRKREANDILIFDVPDERLVALCVRAQMNADGTPAYDQRNCFQGPNGPRLRVAPNALVRASLTPNFTCAAQIVGTGVSSDAITDGNLWESWIELSQFASARDADIGREFKIDINDRLYSPAFSLTLKDEVVVTAESDVLRPPVPEPRIGGKLSGFFDFEMQRGQGAQTFP